MQWQEEMSADFLEDLVSVADSLRCDELRRIARSYPASSWSSDCWDWKEDSRNAPRFARVVVELMQSLTGADDTSLGCALAYNLSDVIPWVDEDWSTEAALVLLTDFQNKKIIYANELRENIIRTYSDNPRVGHEPQSLMTRWITDSQPLPTLPLTETDHRAVGAILSLTAPAETRPTAKDDTVSCPRVSETLKPRKERINERFLEDLLLRIDDFSISGHRRIALSFQSDSWSDDCREWKANSQNAPQFARAIAKLLRSLTEADNSELAQALAYNLSDVIPWVNQGVATEASLVLLTEFYNKKIIAANEAREGIVNWYPDHPDVRHEPQSLATRWAETTRPFARVPLAEADQHTVELILNPPHTGTT